jgi:putative peptidoglycan lipid II flippase
MPEPEHSVVRSAGIVSAAVALSRASGLIREMVMARLFGAGQAYDAFLLGFRIPNLTRDLFAEGALSSAFVPTFTQCLATRGRKPAAELANLVATAVIIVVGLLSLAGVVFSPALVRLLAPGFAAIPGKFELAVQMTRIMFPFLLLVALAAQAMGILNACNQFGIPALSSTFFNLGSVAFGLLLGFWAGPRLGLSPIHGMAVGIVLGGGLQLISQWPSLRRAGFGFRFRVNLGDPDLVRIGQMMVPAILGNAAVQINVMVNTNFASGIWDPVRGLDGPVSWLAYAFRFMQLPLGLFGVAIASATLPAISRSAAAKDMEEFRATLARSLGLVFLLTLPSSAGLALLGRSMIGAIYQGGRFQAYDTERTALALACYAIGLAGYAAIKVLAPAFYALGDSRTPMYVSLASIATNYIVASLMIRVLGMGHAGLALSTSAVALTGFVALFWILRHRLGGMHGRALARDTARILAATAAMAGVVWLSSHALQSWLGAGKLGYLADVALSIPLGAVVFFLAGRRCGIRELTQVRVPALRR